MDSLYELLVPYFASDSPDKEPPSQYDPITGRYLSRLATLPLNSLDSTEPQSLAQSAHSTLLSIQALSTRSSRAIVNSTDHLKILQESIPILARDASGLQNGISTLDKEAINFAEKYSRSGTNEVLDRRKKSLLMSRNVDRLTDVLDLPSLLASAINSSTPQGTASNTNYASALDLYSHIKRLKMLYPDSALLQSIYAQAEDAMRDMASNLISSLRGQNVKLAAAIRTIGWVGRIAPELDSKASNLSGSREGSLGALFLMCRLANLLTMLEALEPLKELANQETQKRIAGKGITTAPNANAWSGGQQTERYLKRYIEIFREQSFAIISMFRSIFPAGEAGAADDLLSAQFKSIGLKSPIPEKTTFDDDDPLHPLPSALATFPLHLVELLTETLKAYMPNVRDKSSRESLLTQVLYCAGSLGRLGGDFSMILALLDDDDESDEDDEGITEWVSVMKKHRVLSGRLEQLSGTSKDTKLSTSESRLKPTA